jgi:GNAT superfamily N-acetyltransferase
MKTAELDGDERLDRLYHEILVPAFPPDELSPLAELRTGVAEGSVRAVATFDDDGRVVAGAVAEWSPSCRVVLLSYLAVAPGLRATGVGGRLYDEAMASWRQAYRPCLILAEVEHPDHHPGDPAHGDPTARLRFYERRGARVLDLPYFQPALGQGRSRVYGMLLLALHVDPELTGPGGPQTVAAQPLRMFLVEYLEAVEGGVGSDPAVQALLRPTEPGPGVPVLPVERYRDVPVALPVQGGAG